MLRDRLRRVCERWYLVEPLLFAVWTSHALVVEPRIHTIRVGRGRIGYNPDYLESLDARRLEAVMRCEATRILLKHPYQRCQESAALSYLASNITLQECLQLDLPLPRARDVFGTRDYDGLYFEFYYHRLRESAIPAAILAEAYRLGQENTEGWGADEFLQQRINDLICEAQQTNRWGTLPGQARELILASLRPALDYRAVLAHFRTSVLSSARVLTRMKPSRRYGFLYMGSRHDFTTRLLVAVDVSGSMSHEDLERGFSIINQFFRYGLRSLDVVWFDTELKGRPETFTRPRRSVGVEGRGGTNLGPVLQFIDEDRSYDGLVVFTDGYAPVPRAPRNRRTRVLWLFNSRSTYEQMHAGLRSLGPAVYLKDTRPGG